MLWSRVPYTERVSIKKMVKQVKSIPYVTQIHDSEVSCPMSTHESLDGRIDWVGLWGCAMSLSCWVRVLSKLIRRFTLQ